MGRSEVWLLFVKRIETDVLITTLSTRTRMYSLKGAIAQFAIPLS